MNILQQTIKISGGMNLMRLRVLPSLSRTVIILHCFIIIRMMAANGSSQVSQSAPGGVKVGRPVSKGQVLGVWWTDKNVLNEAPSQLPEGGVADTNLVAKIRYSMLSLKGDFMDDTGSTVRYDLIKKSPKFQEYLDLVRQLQYVNMIDMRDADRRAFLINIYNSLVIHALVEGLLKKFPGGSLSRVQLYASASYNIGGEVYSLNDIENGLLRGNRLSAVPYTKVPFYSSTDCRRGLMLDCDPRIHFALNCGAVSCPPIAVYSGDQLDAQLNDATKGFLEGNTIVNTADNTITLSMLFKWYKEDFGGSDITVLRWIKEQSPRKLSEAIAGLKRPTLKYPAYNWALNNQD